MPRMAAFFGLIALMAGAIGLNIVRYPMVWDMVGTSAQLSQAGQSAQPTAAAQPEPAPQAAAVAKPAAAKKPAQVDPSARQKDAAQPKPKDADTEHLKEKNAVDRVPGKSADREPTRTARTAKPKGKKPASVPHDKQTPATPAALERETPSPAKEPQDGLAQDMAVEKTAAQKPRASQRAAERAADQAAPLEAGSTEAMSGFAATAEAGRRLVPVVYPPHAQHEPQSRAPLPDGMVRLPPASQVAPAGPDHLPPCAPGETAPRYPSTGR